MSNYVVGLYTNYSTGRSRHAVLCTVTNCWYFPTRYGKKAAHSLADKMNKTA